MKPLAQWKFTEEAGRTLVRHDGGKLSILREGFIMQPEQADRFARVATHLPQLARMGLNARALIDEIEGTLNQMLRECDNEITRPAHVRALALLRKLQAEEVPVSLYDDVFGE